MESAQVPAVHEKRFEIPKVLAAGKHAMDRLSAFESPLVQIATIVLAAAMASIVGGTLIRMLADGLAQS